LSDLNKKFDQVIVYTPGFTERLVFSPFFKLLGLKIIWLEYGPVAAVFKRNFGLPKIIYFLASSFPDQVATISQHSRASLLANTSVSHNKISTIYPGTPCITDKKLKLIKKRGRTWKKNQRLGLKKLITFVGRLTVEKEVDVLLKAFAKLKQKNLQLIIIGTGPEKIIYQNLAKKLKINDRVTFTGFVSETNKTAILAVSEVFVFPSAWEMEGFGITTIEAMMAGIPIITTGAGPQQEIVIDKKTGLFFNPHHPDDLCQKINLLLLNSDLAQKLGRRGRKIALKKFEQTHMQQQTLDLIQSLCV
ncbi:glycosyltransferase family 4 protein, partial [Patescibacteria group bacterium]|nr:glycosyltransferase family 4 protein [Patescibacteria group bacterium]